LSPHRKGESFEVQWLRGDLRGAWRHDWKLGRVRTRKSGDERGASPPIPWLFGEELPNYAGWTAAAKELGEGRVELRLSHPSSPDYVLVFVIERAKGVVLEVQN